MPLQSYYEQRLALLEEKKQKTAHAVAGLEGLLERYTDSETYRYLMAARDELIDKIGMIVQEQKQLPKPPQNDNRKD